MREGGGPGQGLLVGVLGPVEIGGADGVLTPVAQQMQRVLLGLLALASGRAITVAALVDALWGEEHSRERERNLHTHVYALRRRLDLAEPPFPVGTNQPALPVGTNQPAFPVGTNQPGGGGSRLIRVADGYRLALDPGCLDAQRFESLAARAAQAAKSGDPSRAVGLYRQALGLWRGAALADAAPWCPRLGGEAVRLEDLRVRVLEDRLECELALGGHGEAVSELTELTARFPLRERPAGLLMVALWRCGRRGDALAVYDSTRRRLAGELGLDPGPELTSLHARILADDPTLAAPPASEPSSRPAPFAAPVPRQLPAGVGYFAGRDAELKALDEMLDPSGDQRSAVVVTALRGMAGAGKTALAVHWARGVADRFPDGQLYVNLRGFDSDVAPVTPDEAIGWFLAGLGVPGPAIPAEPQARAGLYRSMLADRKVLLLLDNARDVAQVRPLLAGGPGCLALVTSRSSMAGLAAAHGARLLPLGQLGELDAAELLAARLGRERVAGEPAAVASLVRLCAGLPLALAIMAARAAESPGLPLASLAAELEAEPGRLDALDSGDEATSVRTVFSWSVRRLSEPAARMFTLLGVHRGPDISLPAAASLAALTASGTRAALGELASASLINEHRPGRYVLHDLLRVYAAERAATYHEEEIRDAVGRSLDHYLYTIGGKPAFRLSRFKVAAPGPGVTPERLADDAQLVGWLDAEHAVLRQAIEQAADWGFAVAAWQLFAYFGQSVAWQGRWADLDAPADAAVAAAARAGDHAGLGWSLSVLGYMHAELGTVDQGFSECLRALEHFERSGDLVGRAFGHEFMSDHLTVSANRYGAMLHDDLADPESRRRAREGLRHAELAVELHRQAGNSSGMVVALRYAAYHLARLGDTESARGRCEEGARIATATGDEEGRCRIRTMLGFVSQARGRLDEAIGCFLEALSLVPAGRAESEPMRAEISIQLGETYAAAGDLPSARQAWRQGMEFYETLHHPTADLMRARLALGPD